MFPSKSCNNYIMFNEFNIQDKLPTENNIQLLHDFDRNGGKYFSSGLVMFPEGEKTISSGFIFHDRGLEATRKTANIKCY